MTSVRDRLSCALEELRLTQERRAADPEFDLLLTDSDVLDAIDNWSQGQCQHGCSSDSCCDYQELGFLVWAIVENAQK